MDTTTSTHPQPDYPAPDADDQTWRQPLSRPVQHRMLAGVAAGIADYLGVDAAIVRIVLVVLAFVGGAGVPLYLAGWLLIPEEGAEQSIASAFLQSSSHRSH